MVFDTSSPPAGSSSSAEPPLSDERDLAQIEAANKQQQQQQQQHHQPAKWKMMSKRRQSCANDMYATASRYHRLKPITTLAPLPSSAPADEVLPTPSPLFASLDKLQHGKLFSDDTKYVASPSGLITARRSTTDCNDLASLHRRPLEQKSNTLLSIVDEESRDSLWPSSDDHHLLIPAARSSHTSDLSSLAVFYSDSAHTPGSSISSFNSCSNSTDLYTSSSSFYHNMPSTPAALSSSSSGYESNIPTSSSSLNSMPDHLFLSSPDAIMMPPPPVPSPRLLPHSDRNLVEQFIDLHLQKQTSFDQEVAYSPPSSFSSSSSSFLSQAPISTANSPLCCRKCINHDQKSQLSSDTEDDSQSTTITASFLPLQQQQQQQQQQHQPQQNKRPRSLPIAIQQPKGVVIERHYDDDDEDDDSDSSLQNSLSCHCPMVSSRKKRFRTCEFNHQPMLNAGTSANGLFSENTLISTTADKLHIDLKDIDDQNANDSTAIKQSKNSLEHFIMSPTDKVKVQMKYPPLNADKKASDTRSDELKISQPEDIDFKRSKQKAIRVLYQNRLNLNSIQSPVPRQVGRSNDLLSFTAATAYISPLQNSHVLPLRTAANHCDSPLATRTIHPRLFRSVLSCSVIEADDEHEVVSSTTIANRAGASGTREKSQMESFNCLRSNFTESLLHGKILPCGILDGFTVKLGASGLFMPKQVVLPVTTFWFNVSEHQAASPYLRGYHTPTKGTITLALLNPNGTAVHLFLILYDFSDMPPDHRTFIRQRVVLTSETTGEGAKGGSSSSSSKGSLRYLAHIRFVTSQTGKLYMHSDIRLIFARNKLDYDDRTAAGKSQLVTLTETPTPKYWPRK